MSRRELVAACVSSHTGPEWTWLEEPLRPRGVDCRFFYLKRDGWDACRRAIALAREEGGVLVTHGVPAALRCAALQRLSLTRVPHVAWSWHHPVEPRRRDRWIAAALVGAIDAFVVHCGVEAGYQSRSLGVDPARFHVVPWPYEEGARLTLAAPPPTPKDFVCTIGASDRDYRTLFAAMERLPDLHLVVALRPHNVHGLTIPPNVQVHHELPKAQSWSLVRDCRVFVLPLPSRSTRTGHSCLGQAMFFGRPTVVTDSDGLAEYVQPGETALPVPPGDPERLAAALRTLWENPPAAAMLGEAARRFAVRELSEDRVSEVSADLLRRLAGDAAATVPIAAVDTLEVRRAAG